MGSVNGRKGRRKLVRRRGAKQKGRLLAPSVSKRRCVLLRDPWQQSSGSANSTTRWRGRLHDDHEDWAGIDQSRFHVKRDRFRDGRSAKESRKRSNAEDSSFVMLFDDFLEVFNDTFIVTRRPSAPLKMDGSWAPGSCGGLSIQPSE